MKKISLFLTTAILAITSLVAQENESTLTMNDVDLRKNTVVLPDSCFSSKYINFIPHLIEAVKVLKSENEQLKKEVLKNERAHNTKHTELEIKLRMIKNQLNRKKRLKKKKRGKAKSRG
ncbi:MAG: hypothetical protein ABJG47_15400 [Ekhidna sp.]